jgi:hypothetical protein
VGGFGSCKGHDIFLSCKSSGPALAPSHSPVQWEPGLFSDLNQPGRDVDPPLPSYGEVKNEWSYTSVPVHVLMAWGRTAVFFSYTANNTEKGRRYSMPHESCLPGNGVLLTSYWEIP